MAAAGWTGELVVGCSSGRVAGWRAPLTTPGPPGRRATVPAGHGHPATRVITSLTYELQKKIATLTSDFRIMAKCSFKGGFTI